MQIYQKPVRLLMREMVDSLSLKPGEKFTRRQAVEWFAQHYPKIHTGTVHCHLIRLSTNAPARVHYSARPGEDDVFYQVTSGEFRLYDRAVDPPPIWERSPIPVPQPPTEEGDESECASEFAYEADLRDYLANNLSAIEPGLKLYLDEGINGVEFDVGGRRIDILAVDAKGALVVIELKVSRGHERVVGQLTRYMGWIRKNQAEPGQKVRGIIVARKIDDDLALSCSMLSGVELFEYELSFALKRIATT